MWWGCAAVVCVWPHHEKKKNELKNQKSEKWFFSLLVPGICVCQLLVVFFSFWLFSVENHGTTRFMFINLSLWCVVMCGGVVDLKRFNYLLLYVLLILLLAVTCVFTTYTAVVLQSCACSSILFVWIWNLKQIIPQVRSKQIIPFSVQVWSSWSWCKLPSPVPHCARPSSSYFWADSPWEEDRSGPAAPTIQQLAIMIAAVTCNETFKEE